MPLELRHAAPAGGVVNLSGGVVPYYQQQLAAAGLRDGAVDGPGHAVLAAREREGRQGGVGELQFVNRGLHKELRRGREDAGVQAGVHEGESVGRHGSCACLPACQRPHLTS